MKYLIRRASSAAVLAILLASGAVPAQAQAGKAAKSVPAAEVPFEAQAPVRLTSPNKPNIGIRLPFADEAVAEVDRDTGLVAFDNRNGSASVPVAKSDGSVQIMTVIENSMSPETYSYALEIPVGARLEAQQNGAVAVRGVGGEFLGGIAPPWAKDSKGVAVPTRYVIQGTSLTQIVDHRNSIGVVYPVVADPWLGVDLMSTPYVTFHPNGYAVNVQAMLPATWLNLASTTWSHGDLLFPGQCNSARRFGAIHEGRG